MPLAFAVVGKDEDAVEENRKRAADIARRRLLSRNLHQAVEKT